MNPENSSSVPPSPLPDVNVSPTQPVVPAQPQLQFQAQPQIEHVSKPGKSTVPMIAIMVVLLVLAVVGYLFGPKLLTMLNLGKSTQEEMTFAPTPRVTRETPTPQVDDPQTQLEKDIQSVTNKANSVDEDLSNVDKGLNDQPIEQGQ